MSELHSKVEKIFNKKPGFNDYFVEYKFENIGLKQLHISGYPIEPGLVEEPVTITKIEGPGEKE